MIASLTGTVATVGLDRLVVTVGGVGYLVHVTPASAASCRVGDEVSLATTLVVREDSLTVFGFLSPAERDMFETVQKVSGVGPRLALAMLSVMGPRDLRSALASGDTRALTGIPGIGVKSAQRLVLELRDKVGQLDDPGPGLARVGMAQPGWRDQVTEALVGLGWSAKQAAEAVEAVATEAPDGADMPALLRLALRRLRR